MTGRKILKLDEKVRRSVIRAVLKFEKQLPSFLDGHIGIIRETKIYRIEFRGSWDTFSTMSAEYLVTIKATGQKMLMTHHLATFHNKNSGWTIIDKGRV